MALIAQEGLAAGLARQHAIVTLAAERSFIDAALARHQTHNAFRHVDVEVVAHDAPAQGRGRGEESVEEAHEVGFVAGIGDAAADLAGDDVEVGDERLRPMADIFELAPLDPARPHGQRGGDAFERLDAGHLVDRHRPHRLAGFHGAAVDAAHIEALALKIRIGLGREPGADAMRLEVGFFLKSAPPSGARRI